MRRLVLTLAPVLVLSVALVAPARAGRPVPRASYLVSCPQAGPPPVQRQQVLSIDTAGKRFGDSVPAMVRGGEFGEEPPQPKRFASRLGIYSPCLYGNFSSTIYEVNGLKIARDGSFSMTVRNRRAFAWSGQQTTRSVFRLHGRFESATTVSGWFSEVRFVGARALSPYCHTGKRTGHYRIRFSGRQRPIQWIVDHTSYLAS